MADYEGGEDEYAGLDQDEGPSYDLYQSYKEQVVVLVDVCEAMFEYATVTREDGKKERKCCFEVAMELVHNLMKQRIVNSSSDEIALLFYGAAQTQNKSKLEGVFTLLDLDVPDAQRVQEVAGFSVARFQETVGTATPREGVPLAEQLLFGLWAADQNMNHKYKASKRVFILTCNDDPSRGARSPGQYLSQVIGRAGTLADRGVLVELFAFVLKEGQDFRMEPFWQAVLDKVSKEDPERTRSLGPVDTQAHTITATADQDELFKGYRMRMGRKRPAARMLWRLTDNSTIALQLFNLLMPFKLPSTVNVHGPTNALVTSETRFIAMDTGALVSTGDARKVVALKVQETLLERYPLKVVFAQEELEAVRAVRSRPPGMTLLGFKDLACLKDYHQVGHSLFARPNDGEVAGSSKAFKALLDAMWTRNKVAICRYARGEKSQTRLVAVLPQRGREVDGVQTRAEGMNIVFLPFADDIRSPETNEAVVGQQVVIAGEDGVEAARRLMAAITFEDSARGEWDFGSVANPSIQWHFRVLEARALGAEVPDLAEVVDEALPDTQGMEEEYKEEMMAFVKAVYGEDYDPAQGVPGEKKPGSKRKATDGELASQAEEYNSRDWKALAADGGKALSKLTIPQLRVYLAFHSMPVSGNKADVIKRIVAHATGQ